VWRALSFDSKGPISLGAIESRLLHSRFSQSSHSLGRGAIFALNREFAGQLLLDSFGGLNAFEARGALAARGFFVILSLPLWYAVALVTQTYRVGQGSYD
jgi:hypothetical protein